MVEKLPYPRVPENEASKGVIEKIAHRACIHTGPRNVEYRI